MPKFWIATHALAGIDGLHYYYDDFYGRIQNIQFQIKGKSECAKQGETNLLATCAETVHFFRNIPWIQFIAQLYFVMLLYIQSLLMYKEYSSQEYMWTSTPSSVAT